MSIFNLNLDYSANAAPVDANVLYDSGAENTEVTGGWMAFAPYDATPGACIVLENIDGVNRQVNLTAPGTVNDSARLWNKNVRNLQLAWQTPSFAQSFSNAGFRTNNAIDLSNYTKLHIKVTRANLSNDPSSLNWHQKKFGVATDIQQQTRSLTTPPGLSADINSTGETVLDISSLSSGYIYFGALLRTNYWSATADILVEKIWLTNDGSSGGSGGGSSGGSGGGSSGGSSGGLNPTVSSTLFDSGLIGNNSFSTFAPIWAGSSPVVLSGESSAVNRANPVGCTVPTNSNNHAFSIYFRILKSIGGQVNSGIRTNNSIDLTNYSSLHVVCSALTDSGMTADNNAHHYCRFGVTDDITPVYGINDSFSTPPLPKGTSKVLSIGENVLNISSLTGNKYVYVCGVNHVSPQAATGQTNIVITDIWLE